MDKILIVATTSYAGMGPYVSEIVNDFLPEDNVYFLFRDYEDEFFYRNIKKELHSKSTFVKIPNTRWNTLVDLLGNKCRLQKATIKICNKKNIDLVHFINCIPQTSLIKSIEKLGVSVIGTVHDLHPHEEKKEWYKQLRTQINAKRQEENLNECKNIITNSPYQYQELKGLYPDKKVFYHSFPSLVTPEIEAGIEEVPELTTLVKPYILFFGRLEAYKGVHLLYEAFVNNKFLRDKYTLVIAGKGKVYFETSIESGNVLFINRYIKDSEVKCLFVNASCVVYPYISATQSGVLSLAFNFMCPALTSDIPFFKSIIENQGVGCLFKSGNSMDLAKELEMLLKSDNSEMKERQKTFYSENYDKVSLRENLLKIYDAAGRNY